MYHRNNHLPNDLASNAPNAMYFPPEKKATIKQRSHFVGIGALVQAFGLFAFIGIPYLAWQAFWFMPQLSVVFPIALIFGAILGLSLLLVGSNMSVSYYCSNCGNKIPRKDAAQCSHCFHVFTSKG